MTEKTLIIRPHKYNGETSVMLMRMPKDMLAAVDAVAVETGKTRNEILPLSIEFALDNMQIEKNLKSFTQRRRRNLPSPVGKVARKA